MKKNSAFTLVELIVTLLIAGILIAVAGVSYNTYKNKMKLVEASTIIDALSKNEILYYTTNKSFVTFMVPTSNNFTITNQGSKKIVDSSYPSIFAGSTSSNNDMKAPWKALGKPLPDGSAISFVVWAAAGKNNSAGQAITGTTEMQQYSISSNSPLKSYFAIENPGSSNSRCLLDVGYSYFAANMNVADKSWVVINAFANFVDDATDVYVPQPGDNNNYSGTGLCSRAYKYVETDSNGKIVTGNPIGTDSFGH